MRRADSEAFELVQKLESTLGSLPINNNSVYHTPFKSVPYSLPESEMEDSLEMFDFDDVAFVNTSEASLTARHFEKYGCYTKLHPKWDRREYNAWWDEEERKCKEGLVLPGKLFKNEQGEYEIQKIHITGEHYGYLNYSKIQASEDFSKSKGIVYSPNGEPIQKVQNGIVNKSALFPSFWDGDYYFFKSIELAKRVGRHIVVGKARRKGYSYKNAWIVANQANLYRRSTSVVAAYDAVSLFEDGTMNKVLSYLDNLNDHTDWAKGRIHNSLEHIEIGYRLRGNPSKKGFLSNIYTAILGKDGGKIRGKDAMLILIEEAGKCANLTDVLDATLKSLEDGALMTGLMIVFGTGGGSESAWAGFEDLFYNVISRKFLAFVNNWDEDSTDDCCGFFHPCFMSKPGLIDRHGNSDVKGGLAYEKKDMLRFGKDDAKITAHLMEEPPTPSHAFSRAKSAIFSAQLLDAQYKRVLKMNNKQSLGREGIFLTGEGGVVFKDRALMDDEQRLTVPAAIRNYPISKSEDCRGSWVIYDEPYRDPKTGLIPENLYHTWVDPFAISKDKDFYNAKDSLACTIIYEAANNMTSSKGDKIVAVYVGRTEDTTDYDHNMFMGATYYNSKVLYENDRGDVYANALKLGYVSILKTETTFQHQQDIQKGGMGRKYGISIGGNLQRKATAIVYLKNWLITPRGKDLHGNSILNLHLIYDLPILKELLKFDGSKNADRVSCLLIGMYDIKEALFKNEVPTRSNANIDDYFNNPFNLSINDSFTSFDSPNSGDKIVINDPYFN
jgi:hypothetical protein